MPTFITHFSYTAATWSRLIDDPADRTPAVSATVRDAGGELQSLYFAVDDLTGLALFDAPDDKTAMAVSLVIAGSGAFGSVRTQHIVSGSELPTVLENATKARSGFVRPGT